MLSVLEVTFLLPLPCPKKVDIRLSPQSSKEQQTAGTGLSRGPRL